MTRLLKVWLIALIFVCSNVFQLFAQPNSNFSEARIVVRKAQLRLGVGYSSSLYSNKEQFEFSLGSERIVLNSAHPVVYFNKRFNPGDSYQVTQVSGPRACGLDPSQGTFGGQDIVLTADCGYPPLTLFKLEVRGVEAGEAFKFADNYKRAYSVSFSTTLNLGAYPQGDDYFVNQTAGPRPCSMSLHQGVVPVAPIVVKADCGRNPTQPPNDKAKLRLGVGYASSLYSNKEQFEFSIGSEKIVLNTANPVVYFNKRFNPGDSYQVTQLSGPRTCGFPGSQGTFGEQEVVLRVECGNPPLTPFKMEVKGVESGESFRFADNHNRTYSTSFPTTLNLGAYPQGDDYVVNQTAGPRPCSMSLHQGVVPVAPVVVKADCSKSPTQPPTVNPPTSGTSFNEFELVSRSSDDKTFGTFYESFSPVIGGSGNDEGRYVAFVSSAKGLGGGSGKYRQILWRDRKTGETRLVSSGTGGEGNQDSNAPAISADGRSVAFESSATNLAAADTNSVRDVFVWNADTNTVTAVSENRGVEANAEAFGPTISADGKLIAFSSSASTLTSGVEGTSTVNVFLRDMQSGAVTLISKDEKTGKGGGGSRPSISDDGSRIAFYNYFPLTKEDQNNLWDIYVWQSGGPKLRRISKTTSGGEKNQGVESPSRVVSPTISGDGNFVTFATTATNMSPNDGANFQDAFIADINSGRVTLLSLANGTLGNGDSPLGEGEPIAITYDGRKTVFSSKATNLGGRLVMQNLTEGLSLGGILPLTVEGGETSVSTPNVTRGGKCIVFGSNAKLDKRFSSSGIFVTCR